MKLLSLDQIAATMQAYDDIDTQVFKIGRRWLDNFPAAPAGGSRYYYEGFTTANRRNGDLYACLDYSDNDSTMNLEFPAVWLTMDADGDELATAMQAYSDKILNERALARDEAAATAAETKRKKDLDTLAELKAQYPDAA